MNPKMFQLLRARTTDEGVRLSFYLSRGFVEVTPPQWKDVTIDTIRVLRTEDSCGQSMAYDEEYYNGMNPEDAEVIFDGHIEPTNKAKFEFVDSNVELRHTYAYWVRTQHGDTPVGPVPVRVRDPAVWWSQERTEQFMEQLTERYPGFVELRDFGRTTLNHPIRGIVAGNGETTIALTSGVHPRECGGPELLLPVGERLISRHRPLLERVGLAILPSANYEVRQQFVQGLPWLLRGNPNGVDLNRNFDADWENVDPMYGYLSDDPDGRTYRGPAPNSEAETHALVHFLEETHPLAVFSYHGIGGADFVGSGVAKEDSGYCADCERVTAAYTQSFGDGRQPRTAYFTTSGSLPTWVYRHLGVPAFDVEGCDTPIEKAASLDEHTPAMLAEYVSRHAAALVGLMEEMAGTT